MAVRSFRLINANGTAYDLTIKPSFLHSVAGLGYETDTEYQRLGDFFNILSDRIAQATITGVVHFGSNNPQKEYQELVRFLQVKPITMEYTPYKLNDVYYRQGTVTELAYSEQNTLSAEVSFTATSLPYKKLFTRTQANTTEDGKVYDYGYNYRYYSNQANTVTIDIIENTPSGVNLQMQGYLVEPIWQQYVNGILIATGKYNGTVEANEILIVDTTNIPYSIMLKNLETGTLTDVYNFCDFTTERFITLQLGQNEIVITDNNNSVNTITLEANIYYASV